MALRTAFFPLKILPVDSPGDMNQSISVTPELVLMRDFLVFQPGGTSGWSSNHLIFILLLHDL